MHPEAAAAPGVHTAAAMPDVAYDAPSGCIGSERMLQIEVHTRLRVTGQRIVGARDRVIGVQAKIGARAIVYRGDLKPEYGPLG